MMYVFPAAECPDPAIRVTVLYNAMWHRSFLLAKADLGTGH